MVLVYTVIITEILRNNKELSEKISLNYNKKGEINLPS